jgi:hypothetical protein
MKSRIADANVTSMTAGHYRRIHPPAVKTPMMNRRSPLFDQNAAREAGAIPRWMRMPETA